MTNKKSFLYVIKRVVLCCMLLFMFQAAVVPAPAHAVVVFNVGELATKIAGWIKEKLEWVKNETMFGKLITQGIELFNMLKEKLGFLNDTISNAGAAQFFAKNLQARTMIAASDSRSSTIVMANKAAADAAYMANHAAPPHQELCKAIMISELVTTTQDFEREISRIVAEAVANRDRCPGCNGRGAGSASDNLKYRLDEKTMDPMDGVPKGLDTSGARGTAGGPIYGVDTRFIDPSQIYEMPPIEVKVYTDPITSQTWSVRAFSSTALTPPQKFFKGAVGYLFNVASKRPTPVMGAQLFTGPGMVQRAMFNHCAANENALIKQCADYLAYVARPNSKDEKSKALRKSQNDRCEAITGTIDKTRFGNCKEGLSSFEAQLLTEKWCATLQTAAGMKMAGARESEVTEASNVCDMVRISGRAVLETKKRNCLVALSSMSSMNQCWGAVAELGPHGAVAENNLDDPAYLARWRTVRDNGGLDLPSYVMQVRAIKLKKAAPAGQPTAMDEIDLPAAVGQ